jgi:nitrogen fixation protein NifZ
MNKYDWGQHVIACIDLFNDGSYPEHGMDALLVERGTCGEVLRVGTQEDTDRAVYMVEFAGSRVVGCLEEELALA